MLRLSAELAARIREHARQAYPEECCGALLGQEGPDGRQVVAVLPLENTRTDARRNRFLVDAAGVLAAEREAARRGLTLLGWYHSHPDAPARPSAYDCEHAWPWYSYVIVSVQQGQPAALTSWRLQEDRAAFVSEPVTEAAVAVG
jgi:proteasome lid subunit RPN8/RPN11